MGGVFPAHVLERQSCAFSDQGMSYGVRAVDAANLGDAGNEKGLSSFIAFAKDIADRPRGFGLRLLAPMCHVFTFDFFSLQAAGTQ